MPIPDLTKIVPPPGPGRARIPAPTEVVQLPSPPEPPPPPLADTRPPLGPSPLQISEYRRLVKEALLREMEALRLYQPLPIQREFHQCRARTRLLRGSNRSGKTLSAAVEVASAVLNRDQYGRYPARDGRCYVVGRDEKHLGEVIYRKLFRPGAFRMIRDLGTGKWRSYRPWESSDAARKKESKPAPPLIPHRQIQSLTWKSKGDNVPAKVTLQSGWEIDFFSSLGKPPRGSDLDLVWLDEEIVESEWYPEMSSRLMDRGGRMIWGATPQAGTDRLYELHQKCEAGWEAWQKVSFHPDLEPDHREFLILLADNPHIGAKEKADLEADLTEAEALVRIGGQFSIEASKVYPEFNPKAHALDYFDIPPHWTRYAVVDPGRQVCAVLFAAVPDPEDAFPFAVGEDGEAVMQQVGEDDYLFLYDELYIQNCDAVAFADSMRQRCRDQEFEAFICDLHGARITDIGYGQSVAQQYQAELAKRGVTSHATGSGFLWGCDDPKARVEAVRTRLRVRKCGFPTVMAVSLHDKLPNLKWEIERYRYKRTNGIATDTPEDRGRVHLMACLGYLAAYGPKFVARVRPKNRLAPAYASFLRRRARGQKDGAQASRNFGNPGTNP